MSQISKDMWKKCVDLEERLSIAIAALEKIKESDPGPAYHIAKAALEDIENLNENDHEKRLPTI